jgi:hypothetical protein
MFNRRTFPSIPAASCCSEVVGSDFRSWSDLSAAVRSSVFFRFASEERLLNSLASNVADMMEDVGIWYS